MYISRISKRNNVSKEGSLFFKDRSISHGKIYSGFIDKAERILFYVEPEYILILSHTKPNWESINFETKEFKPSLSVGQLLRFSIVCDVSRKSSGTRYKRLFLSEDDDIVSWFEEKSVNNGFKIEHIELLDRSVESFRHKNNMPRFNGVEIVGVLKIVDLEKFYNVLNNGIGKGKAFGFGMLRVYRC
ncbi:MAG: type I-E CRISPR-associated protein Cas6/Cse3/CasE [Phenylobacterium sp.]